MDEKTLYIKKHFEKMKKKRFIVIDDNTTTSAKIKSIDENDFCDYEPKVETSILDISSLRIAIPN